MVLISLLNASRPPADAPTPTTGKRLSERSVRLSLFCNSAMLFAAYWPEFVIEKLT
jgi:hypothetical protein